MLTDTFSSAILAQYPYKEPCCAKWEAMQKEREYTEAANSGKGDSKMYRELAHIYKQIRMGRKLISVNKAMMLAGVHPNGHPVLAIANAAAKWVHYVYDAGRIYDPDGNWNHPAAAFVSDYSVNPGWRKGNSRKSSCSTFRFVRNHFPIRPSNRELMARVPIVPPDKLPRGKLNRYQILFEADWQEAPVDPLLLRRISREWFVVEAEWNLTEVERMVLGVAAFSGE